MESESYFQKKIEFLCQDQSITDKILIFLLKKGIAYTGEIQREVEEEDYKVNLALMQLKNRGFITLHSISNNPIRMLEVRLPDIWAQGLIGQASFKRRKWWIPTQAAVEYLKNAYEGQGVIMCAQLKNYLEDEL